MIVALKRAENAPAVGLKPDTAVVPVLVSLVLVVQLRFTPGSMRVSTGSPLRLVLLKYSAFTPALLTPLPDEVGWYQTAALGFRLNADR
ncbi:hypothetical protein D3C73_1545790 [compost metagenome]